MQRCMYVCMYVCVFTHLHTHTYARTHICGYITHTCINTHIYTLYMSLSCTFTYTHSCIPYRHKSKCQQMWKCIGGGNISLPYDHGEYKEIPLNVSVPIKANATQVRLACFQTYVCMHEYTYIQRFLSTSAC